jgi:hypothetical protein
VTAAAWSAEPQPHERRRSLQGRVADDRRASRRLGSRSPVEYRGARVASAIAHPSSAASAFYAHRRWLWPIAIFAAAYAALAVTYAVVETIWRAPHSFIDSFIRWDGSWYFRVATDGYPAALDHVHGRLTESTAAFFPLYPMVLRGATLLTFGNWCAGAIVAEVITGLAMAVAVWWYVADDLGRRAADRAVVLTLLLPGTTVMAMGYTEPLAIALSAWCLLALRRRRWMVAGFAAALGSITRPDMLALTVACLWSGLATFAGDRDRKAVVAPMIAPLGAGAWLAIQATRYQSWKWWFRLERQAWDMRFDFGRSNAGRLFWLTTEPARHPTFYLLADVTLLLFVLALALAWPRLRPEARAYVLVMAVLSLGSSLPTIRYLFKAWPVSVVGEQMPRRAYLAVVALLAAAFVAQGAWWPFQPSGAPAP